MCIVRSIKLSLHTESTWQTFRAAPASLYTVRCTCRGQAVFQVTDLDCFTASVLRRSLWRCSGEQRGPALTFLPSHMSHLSHASNMMEALSVSAVPHHHVRQCKEGSRVQLTSVSCVPFCSHDQQALPCGSNPILYYIRDPAVLPINTDIFSFSSHHSHLIIPRLPYQD